MRALVGFLLLLAEIPLVFASVVFLVITFCRVSVTRRRFFGPSKSCVSLLAVSVMGCDAIGCDKDRLPDDLGFVMVSLLLLLCDFGNFSADVFSRIFRDS
jgi:hypothetical protein